MVIPPGLPEDLAVKATAALRAAAAPADVNVTWLETALDTEFSLIRTRRADAGLGWLTTSPDAVPAPLAVMILGEFEPDLWIPSTDAAAHRGTISLEGRNLGHFAGQFVPHSGRGILLLRQLGLRRNQASPRRILFPLEVLESFGLSP